MVDFLASLNGWQIAGLIWVGFTVIVYLLMWYDVYKYRHINKYDD